MNVAWKEEKSQLLNQISVLMKAYSPYEVESLKDGFALRFKTIPFAFHVTCFSPIGWNVFIVPEIAHKFKENTEANRLYDLIEKIIIEFNGTYYN